MNRKILAVIPARAGSKGIPNKNIRIVGGHPLVYYSIKNALSSKYVTDVVVTTDSPVVRVVAEEMGARCRWRDVELCGDAVTLDSVVVDAIPLGQYWDYVITMQPTSPTLKSETLDKAIEYAISHDLDTLISVINAPHLTWGLKDGKIVPNYTERLNRQYLPPCYLETGAFVISRTSIITAQTRFGRNVEVFEIPENEAQDIDTFNDLRNVAYCLVNKSIAIYVNGNNVRGTGHVYRALELADEFYSKPDIYYDINQTSPKIFGNTTHNIIGVDGIAELFEACKIKQYSFFVNDILDTSVDYMIGLKRCLPEAKIINFEDEGEGTCKADLVINALLPFKFSEKVCAGEKYYIAAKPFLLYSPVLIKDTVRKIFICFGGADPQNYTDRVLKIIEKEQFHRYNFVVALGKSKKNIDELMQYNRYENIEVLHDVSNMPGLMCGCDIAITSRGRTAYELALLGIPTIAMAQNKREENHSFICNENGFSYIGLNPSNEIIEATLKMFLNLSKKNRQHFQELLLSHDLRNGRKHVMNLIRNL